MAIVSRIELDAVSSQHLAERFTERAGFAGEDTVGAGDQDDLGTESAYRLCHLHADRSAAEDYQPTRDRRQRSGFPVPPNAIELGKARDGRNDGGGPGGDDDVVCRECRIRRPRLARHR